MPQHGVRLDLQARFVAHKDIEVKIKSDGALLGRLLISKGNLEWLPANNSVNKHRLPWEGFAELMEEHGRPTRR